MDSNTAVQTPTERATPEDRLITGEELHARGDLGPCELVEGRIVHYMPTSHPPGFIENLVAFFLTLFNREHQLGRVLAGEVGIYTGRDPDSVRAADVAFISRDRLRRVQSDGFLDVAPELVVEIMSPGNSWSDVQQKLIEYFSVDVKMVWVVDPQLEQVHVYRGVEQVTLLKKQDELTADDLLPGFKVALTEIFEAE